MENAAKRRTMRDHDSPPRNLPRELPAFPGDARVDAPHRSTGRDLVQPERGAVLALRLDHRAIEADARRRARRRLCREARDRARDGYGHTAARTEGDAGAPRRVGGARLRS